MTHIKKFVEEAEVTLVALSEEEGVGYLNADITETGIELRIVHVHPEKRGMGIGSALLHEFLNEVKQRGYRTFLVKDICSQRSFAAIKRAYGEPHSVDGDMKVLPLEPEVDAFFLRTVMNPKSGLYVSGVWPVNVNA